MLALTAFLGVDWVVEHIIEVAIVAGTCGALAVAAVLLLVRWSDRRAAAVFAARSVYQLPPASPPRLEAPGRPAIEPHRELHLHLTVTPDQLAAIMLHHLEEDR